MSTNLDYITCIPSEIRQEIFSYLPPQDLFGLGKVCKQWNRDLDNDFFQKKCYEIFQSLKLFPAFYDPILKTVKTPWKLICFSLSDTKKKEKLHSVAERMAQLCHSEFDSYERKCTDFIQSELGNHESEMQSICGDYYQDPHSNIDQAWKFFKDNWSKEEEEEIRSLAQLLFYSNTDPGLGYWVEMLQDLMNTSDTDSEIVETLKKSKADRRVIRYQELIIKHDKAKERYYQLETKRMELKWVIAIQKDMINYYSKITQNSENSHLYATETIYHILYLLAYLKKWGDYVPTLSKLTCDIENMDMTDFDFNEIQEGIMINRIKEEINSLPLECSTHIWKTLYDTCANNAQEWQWSEKHFNKNLAELQEIISEKLNDIVLDLKCFFEFKSYKSCNVNPCLHPEFLNECADRWEEIADARKKNNFSLQHVLLQRNAFLESIIIT